MKKQKKNKKTPSEKQKERRAKRKLKSKRLEEEQRSNWVEDTLRWVDAEEYRRQYYMNDEASKDNGEDDSSEYSSENEGDHGETSDAIIHSATEEEEEEEDPPDDCDGRRSTAAVTDDETTPSDKNTATTTTTTTNSNTFSIISWNVLADAYCNRSSHRELPPKFQRRVFDRKQRRHHVQQTLRRLVRRKTQVKQDQVDGNDTTQTGVVVVVNDRTKKKTATSTTTTTTSKSSINCISPDLLALQEVDPPLGVAACLKEQGYEAIETVATKGGRVGRVDSCGLYYKEDVWTYARHETVFLDDLATNCSSDIVGSNDKIGGDDSDNTNARSKKTSTNMNESLRGLQTSLARKNVALLVKLHHKPTGRDIVVANAHFFWNPAYEYVKLCQAHYVSCRALAFRGNEQVPIIFCGDFNSQPNSQVHRYFVEGSVNAKLSAPWYACTFKTRDELNKQAKENIPTRKNHQNENGLEEKLRDLRLDEQYSSSTGDKGKDMPPIRYMVDFTLNRFCRWLRILGIDAEIEKEHEEIERTKEGNFVIIDRCRKEGRSLVTTSSKLLQRKDCPPGAYKVDVRCSLEDTLVHLLLSHGVLLQPSKMLTRCVVCNGGFVDVHDNEKKRQIFESQQAPSELNDQSLDVYECNNCGQGFWWCEKPNSSASRVKLQATKLLEVCVAGDVNVSRKLGLFENCVDIDEIRAKQSTPDTSWALQRLSVVDWLQKEHLENPLKPVKSVYASKEDDCEPISFTNVTSDFVGHLDWIMYQTDGFDVDALLHVPKTFEELNDFNIPNGHLLPSYDWPSDHLAVGARLSFRPNESSTRNGSCQAALPSCIDTDGNEKIGCVIEEDLEEEKKDSLETEPPFVSTIHRD